MFDYIKYALSPVLVIIAGCGFWVGGNYTWLGLGTLLSVMFADAFLEPDHQHRDQRYPWVYDTVVAANISLGLSLILLYAFLVGSGHFQTRPSAVGAFVTMMFVQFVAVAPSVHEMFHRENTFLRWVGRLGMVMILDPWREITHVVTHHIHTVTPTDPDYARRGENLYRHLLRTFRGQIAESYHLEKRMWTKRERNWWDLRNAWVWRLSIVFIFVAILWLIGGWTGTLASVGVCLFGPRTLLEIFNFTQHYGLVTCTPGRFERRHTWNHLSPCVRLLAFEITNHAPHHEDSYKPFYQLEPDRSGPQQPHFFLCFLLALVPPLWFAMIRPRLKDWDRNYANRQERELAESENIRAGWGDLNEDAAAAEHRYAFAI